MTKIEDRPAVDSPNGSLPTSSPRPAVWVIVLLLLANVAIIAIQYNARRGAVAARIANPAVHGAPRPVAPLLHHDWIPTLEVGTALGLVALVVIFVLMWQRYPKHPVLLMVIVTTAIVWMDPIMNWAPYAAYNPQLTHFPETWPLASLSPTVEPFIGLGYATFYLGAYFPAIWILRRIQARRPIDSFAWRHPLISLALLILVIGFIYDAILETILVRTQLYIYSQVIPFGSLFTGKPYQFPLLWESTFVCWVMIPAGVLLYRDDTGRTQAEKLAQRIRPFRPFRARPALAAFTVMFAILNVAYFCYGASFGVIRATGAATSVACPWPFPEAKVYDPQGFYAEAGQPGPYMAGIWDGWESAQSGRPNVATNPDGRCSPKNVDGSG
jgi:Spirocyclase AveC-like